MTNTPMWAAVATAWASSDWVAWEPARPKLWWELPRESSMCPREKFWLRQPVKASRRARARLCWAEAEAGVAEVAAAWTWAAATLPIRFWVKRFTKRWTIPERNWMMQRGKFPN